MIVLLGKSGAGKSAIRNYLTTHFGYKSVISCTTRPKRENEIDGKDYYFLNTSDFAKNIAKNNFFVEFNIYKDNFYGIPFSEIKHNGILIMEPYGFLTFKERVKKDSFVSFFIAAPEDVREDRMIKRGDNIEDIHNKIEADLKHFDLGDKDLKDEVDFSINSVNYNLEEVSNIIHLLYSYISNNTQKEREDKL